MYTYEQEKESLPLRKCGLKLFPHSFKNFQIGVTSLEEVWIETVKDLVKLLSVLSLPLRKCGLKRPVPYRSTECKVVTSLAEVWIETGQ